MARQQAAHAAVIMVSGVGGVAAAVEALKQGAFDFLSKPINLKELKHRIERALEKRLMAAEIADLHRQLREQHGIDNMVGNALPCGHCSRKSSWSPIPIVPFSWSVKAEREKNWSPGRCT